MLETIKLLPYTITKRTKGVVGMAFKPCLPQIDMRQHEINNRGTPMFPCAGYFVSVGGHIAEGIPWHWHDEVEVLVVVSGVFKLEVPNHTLTLQEGEAAFINSKVLHSAVNADKRVCEIKSFVFDPKLIFGSLDSVIEHKYVRPLVSCPQLCVIHLQNSLGWHKEAIRCIEEAFVNYQGEAFGYELLVRDYLSKLWYLIVSNQQSELEQQENSKNTEAIRVKEMLGYIHAHYKEPMRLKSISQSAAVSDRECLRCFNRVLGITPIKYLLHYRISVAAGLLTNSDMNITEICKVSGFESPSYFALKFKALTDKTPSEYRQRGKGASGPTPAQLSLKLK